MKSHTPERTCVVCRGRAERSLLLRFVRTGEGKLVLDFEQRLPGRGTYCHCSVECLGRKNTLPLLVHSLNRREGKPRAGRPEVLKEVIAQAISHAERARAAGGGTTIAGEVLRVLKQVRAGMEDLPHGARAKGIRL